MKSKRWLCLLLAAMMCLGSLTLLGSCKPREQAEKTVVSGVYRASDLPLPEGISYINQLTAVGDRLYFMGESYIESTYTYKNAFYSMKTDGSELKELDFEWFREEGGYISALAPASDGSLWLYYNEYYELEKEPETDANGETVEPSAPSTDTPAVPMPLPMPRDGAMAAETVAAAETVSAPETETSPETTENKSDGGYVETAAAVIMTETVGPGGMYIPADYVENNYLIHVSADGEELARVDLDVLKEEKELPYLSVSYLTALDGKVFFSNNNMLIGYAADGTLLFCSELETDWINNMFADGKTGQLVVGFYKEPDYSKLHMYPVDLTTGKLSDTEYAMSELAANNSYNIKGGPGYSFYFNTQSAIYGYDSTTGTETELLNYVNSDLDRTGGAQMAILSDKQFITVTYDYESEKTQVMLQVLDFVPPEQVTPKYILTMSYSNYLSSDIRRQVIAFNKSNENYRIQLKDYSVYNNEENEWKGAADTLNAEILAGQIPDILIVEDSLPFASYASKGLFADLYELMDADESIKKEDFLPNIFKAQEINGCLYELTPVIQIITAEAKAEHLNGLTGWNMAEFTNRINSLPENMKVFGDDVARNDVLQALIMCMYDELVDKDSGECYFDTDYFKSVLTFVSTLPEKSIWEREEEMPEDYWQQYENRFKSDLILLNMDSLYTFQSYWSNKQYNFGNVDTTFIGFPCENRNGAAFQGQLRLAISSQSLNRDGAWEFLRSFLSDEYQDKQDYQWPIKLSSLDKMAEKVLNPEPKEGDGEYDDYIIVGGYYYTKEMGRITQETVDEILAVVKSADKVIRQDEDLLDIITAEAEAFFSGAKTVDAVTPIIQSKAKMYINEQR